MVHVNAEFADQTSDHDPSVVRLRSPVCHPEPTTFASLRSLTTSYSNDPAVTAVLNGALTTAETARRPLIRTRTLRSTGSPSPALGPFRFQAGTA